MSTVCPDCIEDYVLAEFIRENAWEDECSYCETKGENLSAEVSDVAGHILEIARAKMGDPSVELPWDPEDQRYLLGTVYDSPWDLFEVIGFELTNDELMEEICDCISVDVFLCEPNPIQFSPLERMQNGWARFCRVIKNERRYTFLSAYDDSEDPSHPDYFPTADVLKELAEVIKTANLVRPLSPDTGLWRARIDKTEAELNAAHEFASPPEERARFANRMSPAGISMFYGSSTKATAIAEVVTNRGVEAGKSVFIAAFHPARMLSILDLVDLPTVPSFFDDKDKLRHALYFLLRFRSAVSESVAKDGREHIDYVPTQAFSEFIRFELKTDEGESVDGIRYASSVGSDDCFVIFADHEACLSEEGESWKEHRPLLRFDAGSVERLDAQWVSTNEIQ